MRTAKFVLNVRVFLTTVPLLALLHYSVGGCAPSPPDNLIVNHVREGDIEAVQSYIDRGGDVNARFLFNKTLLHHAIQTRQVAAAELLVAAGADPDLVDVRGYTPLHWTAMKGYAEEAQVLANVGINLEVCDRRSGENALHKAAWYNHVEVLQILIGAGADVNAQTYGDEIAFTEGEDNPYTFYNYNFREELGRTPLHMAAHYNRVEPTRLLLEAGADTKVTTMNGLTPLHTAVLSNSIDVIQLLLAANADLSITDNNGNTPLDAAKEKGRKEIVVLLERHDSE